MADVVAYELRADYQGTVEITTDDGTQEIPKFAGGLLNVGDGDINVAEALEDGGGVIVVQADDQRLRDLLDAYPPLKRSDAPAGAEPLSKYGRAPLEDLRSLASVRDIKGAGSLSRAKLVSALEAQDKASRAGAARAAAAIAAAPEIADGLEDMTKEQLLTLAAANDVTASGNKPEILAALRDAGVAQPAEGGDA